MVSGGYFVAEICADCLNEIFQKNNEKPEKFILSRKPEFCECCCEYKRVVIVERKTYYKRKFKFFLIPFRFILSLIMLPYLIYRRKKTKKR